MKKIQCLNHFFPHHVAGTEVYVWALSKHLQLEGCEVSVLIPHYGFSEDDQYHYDDIPVYRYAEPSVTDRALLTGQRLPDGLKSFTRYLTEEKPDVVHFHEIAGSNGISVHHFEAAKATGAKIVFTMHLAGNTCNTSTLMFEGRTLCDGIIIEKRCAYCSLVKKTSSRLKSSMILNASLPFYKSGINPIKWQHPLATALSFPFIINDLRHNLDRIINVCDLIIPITHWYYNILLANGVPDDKMNVVLQAIPIQPQVFVGGSKQIKLPIKLIFIGRIEQVKGVSLLLEAAKLFTKDQLQVDLYGSPSDHMYLQECKSTVAAHNNIRFMGKISQPEVVPVMRNYDALILPSLFSEMSPLVIQEAFAAGLPVIGSNVFGIAEQVQHDVNGLLFEFNNVASLQAIFKKIIFAPSLLSSLSANVKRPLQFKEVALKIISLYQSLMGEKTFIAI